MMVSQTLVNHLSDLLCQFSCGFSTLPFPPIMSAERKTSSHQAQELPPSCTFESQHNDVEIFWLHHELWLVLSPRTTLWEMQGYF